MTATSHSQGSSFGNAINYIYEGRLDEHKDKKEELIMHSDNIRVPRGADDLKGRNRMKSDFISQAEAHKQYGNENRKNYVGHHSLNFSASDMVGLSPKKIEQITEDYIKDAGINQTQYIAVAHRDTDHYHVHIIFNRATDKQTLYNDWREYNKTAERAVALNLKYGFAQEKKQVKMASSPEVLAIRSGHDDIQKIRADELIGRAKNLHHLSKICATENRFYSEENGSIRVGEQQYRKEDLQAVFYDNRSEDRAKVRQRHIEETTQRKQERVNQPKDYEIKESKREDRATERAVAELVAQQKRKNEALEQSLRLKEHIAGQLKGAKSEKQFIEDLVKEGIKVTEGQDKATYVFERSAGQLAMSKHEIRNQLLQNMSSPLMEQSRPVPSQTAEPSTGLGVGTMAGQKTSGNVRKLDGNELDQEEQKKRSKERKRVRGF
jgi:Relaxase/Mobilisation nuclease domain